jgi:hypothetical protein
VCVVRAFTLYVNVVVCRYERREAKGQAEDNIAWHTRTEARLAAQLFQEALDEFVLQLSTS